MYLVHSTKYLSTDQGFCKGLGGEERPRKRLPSAHLKSLDVRVWLLMFRHEHFPGRGRSYGNIGTVLSATGKYEEALVSKGNKPTPRRSRKLL